jgi:N-methylhydantoinase B
MALDEKIEIFDEAEYQDPDRFGQFRVRSWPRSEKEWERIEADKAKLDPILLEVIEGGLEAAIREAEAAVERTARSSVIREQHDYRAAINTIDCDTATHVSWAATADPIRTHYPLDQIQPGDVFLYNDVYESHGGITHLPDYCAVSPLFGDEGRMIGFGQIFGHVTDVGGRVVGSWPIRATNVYEEGVQIPPVKLYAQGVLNDEVFRIVLRNSRYPEELRGDIDAFVGALRVIERRVVELCQRVGTDLVEAGMYAMIDRCAETLATVVLPKIPDGVFVGDDFLENDGITLGQPVRLRVTMKKDPEKIIFDWTGTDPQTEGGVNWPAGGRFLSKWLGSFFQEFAPGTLINEGATQVMRNYLPHRTVMSSEYPRPVANRMPTMFRNLGAYRVAMAKAFHGHVVADFNCVQVYGFVGFRDGEEILYREIFGAGSGARPYADGTDAVDLVPDSKNLPAEFIEQRFPVIVERVGLNPNSGGPGKYRGGLGYLKELRVLVDGYYFTYVERTAFGPFGVAGGQAGAPGSTWMNFGSPDEERLRFSHEHVHFKAGTVIRITTPGGGGWGDPLERDPESVRLDVLSGIVSVESASDDYGVIVHKTQDGLITDWELDPEATTEQREQIRQQRKPLQLIDRGPYAEELRQHGTISYDDTVDGWDATAVLQETSGGATQA